MAADEKVQQLLTSIELLKAENRQLQATLENYAQGLQSRDSHERFFDQWASRLARPEINQDIHLALAALNLHLALDFLTLFDFRPEQSAFQYCHGYPPRDPAATDATKPKLNYPWLFKRMLKNMVVVIQHRDDLPPEAQIDFDTLKAHDIESLVAIPHFGANGLIGIGTYGLNKARFQWQAPQIKLLEDFTKIAFSHIAQQRLLDHQTISADVLSSVLESAKVGFAIWDRKSVDTTYSPNCAKLLGYHEHENIDVFSHIHPDDQPLVIEKVTHTIKTGLNHSVIYRVLDKDKNIHWYQQHASTIRKDSDGKVSRVISSFINIDEEHQAKQERKRLRRLESELFKLVTLIHADHAVNSDINQFTLRSLVNLVPAERCFICVRSNADEALSLRYEWTAEGIKSLSDLFKSLPNKNSAYFSDGSPIGIDQVTEQNRKLIPIGDDCQSALIIPINAIRNMATFLVLERVSYCREWSNIDKRFASTIADALGIHYVRTRLTKKLIRSEQRFREAMETTQDGIWEWDLETNAVYLSPGLLRIAGYEADELPHKGKTLASFSHPEELPRVKAEMDKLKRNEIPFQEGLIRWIHKSGRTVWVYGRARCVERDNAGNIKRLAAVVSDHTKIIKQQEALEAARKIADAANTAKTEFLARMSHEIRTPMNAILGMAHLAKDTDLNEQQSTYIEHIDQAAHSLLHIINEVLDFSKIEAGKLSLEYLPFRFETLFDQLDKLLSLKASEKGLELLFQPDPEIPEYLEGDSLRIGQILTNLVTNAIKFTETGQVLVKARLINIETDKIRVKFSVQDSGIGISDAQLTQLFNPFTQADGSTTRRFGGTGLGLSICKRLVNLMGGEIRVDSKEGSGSCFEFDINLMPCTQEAMPSQDIPKLSALRTLIVDDNPTALEVINATAKSLKLDTHIMNNGKSALSAMANNSGQYDLILMDYAMPDMDGVSASKAIKQLPQKSPPMIIMVSACDREQIMTAANRGIIDGFVSKPITQSRLYNAITRVLGTQPSPETSAAKSQRSWPQLKDIHLLLVEDNPVNQKVAQGLLQKQQVNITIANNGQEAIDILLAHDPAYFKAVLMDVEMPLVDGYQATQFIRQKPEFHALPIIAMTAHAMKSDQQKCLDAGMNAFVHKPIKPAVLYDTLASQIRR
ncbi:response regulator [Simiduia curdlanivorans]|uniref:histidine kinase n=1 Tax=Simiduia curdlanivorans TaxID=1492769 RepID=A0ABV8V1D4_9GAMM|nr:response regulator [Simiduia curdlanivorans]MDN3638130.1 response regulator [Simiduia curdlanivorans]